MPLFTAADALSGRQVEYQQLWQRKNLVLISLPADAPRELVDGVVRDMAPLVSDDTGVVVTTDAIPGIPRPGVVVADRWGEVYHVHQAPDVPRADELREWLRFVRQECPECQGEAR
jgi:hypothetical protein